MSYIVVKYIELFQTVFRPNDCLSHLLVQGYEETFQHISIYYHMRIGAIKTTQIKKSLKRHRNFVQLLFIFFEKRSKNKFLYVEQRFRVVKLIFIFNHKMPDILDWRKKPQLLYNCLLSLCSIIAFSSCLNITSTTGFSVCFWTLFELNLK